MSRRLIQAITSVGLLFLAGSLHALSIPINTFATGENAGSATVATLNLNQSGSDVNFSLTNSVGNLGSAANAGTFISDLGFNYSGGTLTSSQFTNFGGSGQSIVAGDFAIDPSGNFQGGYNFFLELGFPTTNKDSGAQRFLNGESVSWTITNVMLSDFLDPVSGTGGSLALAAVHIQSLASGESTTYISAVPLPAAAWLFLSALGGLVGVKKLRARSSTPSA